MTRRQAVLAFVALLAGAALLVVYADQRQSNRIDSLQRANSALQAAKLESVRELEIQRTQRQVALTNAAVKGKQVAVLRGKLNAVTAS
jgi:hypothetical protein